jgi:hypothetical protein
LTKEALENIAVTTIANLNAWEKGGKPKNELEGYKQKENQLNINRSQISYEY